MDKERKTVSETGRPYREEPQHKAEIEGKKLGRDVLSCVKKK